MNFTSVSMTSNRILVTAIVCWFAAVQPIPLFALAKSPGTGSNAETIYRRRQRPQQRSAAFVPSPCSASNRLSRRSTDGGDRCYPIVAAVPTASSRSSPTTAGRSSATTGSATKLRMGIRSFLRNNLVPKNEDDDDGSDSGGADDGYSRDDLREARKAINADLRAVELMDDEDPNGSRIETTNDDGVGTGRTTVVPTKRTLPSVPPPVPPPPSSSSSSVHSETVKQRIQRLRSGSMTEDEKLRFLQTALSPPSNKKKDAVRIRQAIPTPDTDDIGRGRRGRRGSGDDKGSPNSSSRSLWNVIGNSGSGGKSSPRSISNPGEGGGSRGGSGGVGSGEMTDSAKREYLAMVTDPNRFQSYVVVGGGGTKGDSNTDQEEVEEEEVPVEMQEVDDEIVVPTAEPITTVAQPEENGDAGGDIEAATTNPTAAAKEDDTDSSTLASRLEEDAILREQYDAEAKAQREAERIAEAERTALLQQKWEEERLKVEGERMEKERLAREEVARLEEEERKVEEERMEKVIEAQEEYWREKLEEERMAKEERLRAKGEKDVVVGGDKKKGRGVTKPKSKDNGAVIKDTPSPVTEVASFLPPPPPLSQATPPPPPQPVVAPEEGRVASGGGGKKDSSFVQEQARKRAATDRIKEEHRARVQSMNSPIPSGVSPRATPIVATPIVVPRSSPAAKVVPSPPPPSTAPPSTAPPFTLAQLTMGKKFVAGDVKPVATTTAATATPPTSKSNIVVPPLKPLPPRLSLAQLTMGKKKKKPDEGLKENQEDNDNTNGGIKRPKVRQRVPTGDDDDEFFEFSSGGSNKDLSIKDIMAKQKQDGKSKGGNDMETMKKKARNYGIDMDKFT